MKTLSLIITILLTHCVPAHAATVLVWSDMSTWNPSNDPSAFEAAIVAGNGYTVQNVAGLGFDALFESTHDVTSVTVGDAVTFINATPQATNQIANLTVSFTTAGLETKVGFDSLVLANHVSISSTSATALDATWGLNGFPPVVAVGDTVTFNANTGGQADLNLTPTSQISITQDSGNTGTFPAGQASLGSPFGSITSSIDEGSIIVVPEPSTLTLTYVALCGLLLYGNGYRKTLSPRVA